MININELRQNISTYGLQATCADDLIGLLDRLEAWESVFGHLGTPDEVGNEWHSLSDRLEAAEKETKSLREGLKRMCLDEDADAKEAKVLRAKIEAMEKQGPVGKFIQHPSHGMWEQDGYGDNPDAKPLYALPGAQPAPSVPEGFALVNKAHFLAVLDREDWRTAKNRAELRAMLAAAAPEAKP